MSTAVSGSGIAAGANVSNKPLSTWFGPPSKSYCAVRAKSVASVCTKKKNEPSPAIKAGSNRKLIAPSGRPMGLKRRPTPGAVPPTPSCNPAVGDVHQSADPAPIGRLASCEVVVALMAPLRLPPHRWPCPRGS